ncbi:MAG: hypothetical protein BIFFINMI_00025 [Phycisphaerae bacterium]|nr:hypothetical protein [Phycisphaerae bacterium]
MNLLYPGAGAVAHDRVTLAGDRGGPLVVLENERVRCAVLPWFGAAIVELTDKASGVDVLAPDPGAVQNVINLQHPITPPQIYFNRKVGGWPELFPTGSRLDDYFGLPQPFHGESNQRRWDYAVVEAGPRQAMVRFTLTCRNAPLRLVRDMILEPGAAQIVLRERAENLSQLPIPIMWGHHPTFGAPFLEAGVRIELPGCRFIEGDASMLDIPAPGAKVGNMFYAADLAEGWFGLFNPRLKLGVGVRFDAELFRYLWLWQEFNANDKPPAFGRWYAAAVEPFTSLPAGMDKEGAAGPSVTIAPGRSLSTELTAFFYGKPLKG